MAQQQKPSIFQAYPGLFEAVYTAYTSGKHQLPEELKAKWGEALSKFSAQVLGDTIPDIIRGRLEIGFFRFMFGKNRYFHLTQAWKIVAETIQHMPENLEFNRADAHHAVAKGKELLTALEAELAQVQEKLTSVSDSWIEQKKLSSTLEPLQKNINALKANLPTLEDWVKERGMFDRDVTKRPGYQKKEQPTVAVPTEQQREQDQGAAKALADLAAQKPVDAPEPMVAPLAEVPQQEQTQTVEPVAENAPEQPESEVQLQSEATPAVEVEYEDTQAPMMVADDGETQQQPQEDSAEVVLKQIAESPLSDSTKELLRDRLSASGPEAARAKLQTLLQVHGHAR